MDTSARYLDKDSGSRKKPQGRADRTLTLIHEASFFIQLPLVLIATAFDGKTLNPRRFFILLGIAGGALGAIVFFSHTTIGRTEFVDYMHTKLHPTSTILAEEHFAGYYVLFATFFENIKRTFNFLLSSKGILGAFTVAIFLYCWFIFSRYIQNYLKLNTSNAWLVLFLTGSSPLILVCLGVDWYRWCTLMAINALAITAFLALRDDAPREPQIEKPGTSGALRRVSLWVFLFFAVAYPQFPPWHPVSGNLKDGVQCLAADYGLFSEPEKRHCPSEDFRPKS